MTGKWGRPRHGADRIVNRLKHRRDSLGNARADLVERTHWSQQHTTIRGSRKPGGSNFAVELGRRHELAVRPLDASRLEHPLYRIVKKKSVESVSVHHGQKHRATRPEHAVDLAQCLPNIRAVKIPQNFDANDKIK